MRTITPEEVIKALPSILKEHPEIKVEIYQILSKEYVTRAELKEYIKRSDKRFEEMDKRFERLIEEINRRFEDLHSWVGIVVGGSREGLGRVLRRLLQEL